MFNEISYLKATRHPNILMMIGVALTQDLHLLILSELCEERSLKQYMSKYKSRISLGYKYRILFDIGKAMYYMHTLSPAVIHRDIKSENIFIAANFKAILGDFG